MKPFLIILSITAIIMIPVYFLTIDSFAYADKSLFIVIYSYAQLGFVCFALIFTSYLVFIKKVKMRSVTDEIIDGTFK